MAQSHSKIKLRINGEPYKAVVAHVTGRDRLGRPRECRLLYDEETVHLEGGEEFLVLFAKASSITSKQN